MTTCRFPAGAILALAIAVPQSVKASPAPLLPVQEFRNELQSQVHQNGLECGRRREAMKALLAKLLAARTKVQICSGCSLAELETQQEKYREARAKIAAQYDLLKEELKILQMRADFLHAIHWSVRALGASPTAAEIGMILAQQEKALVERLHHEFQMDPTDARSPDSTEALLKALPSEGQELFAQFRLIARWQTVASRPVPMPSLRELVEFASLISQQIRAEQRAAAGARR